MSYRSVLIILVLWVTVPAFGQKRESGVDLGLHYSLLSFDGLRETDHGMGVRLGVEVVRGVGADLELNGFYRDLPGWYHLASYRVQGLFGIKAGLRGNRVGVFAKCRPGFLYTSHPAFGYGTQFALDLGGVAEVYPSRHLVLRFDVGDTMLRYPGTAYYYGPDGHGYMTHNLQFSAGVGYRF